MMDVEVSVGYVVCCKYLVDMFSRLDLFRLKIMDVVV